jgi:membrane-bound lytic murein transglycosylase D
VLSPDLPIRARFALRVGGFLLVLASGTSGLAAAEFLPWSAPEEAAYPPDPSVEPLADEGGSAGDTQAGDTQVVVVPDHSWYPRVETDPWAEAFAESSAVSRPVTSNKPAATRALAPAPGHPTQINQQVQFFLDRFTRERRAVVDKWFGRAGRYLEMIRETLRGHGLPEDLAFVAMIESGFNPAAVSRAGAKGLWQFMAGTARRYGLRVDQWVDERFDPEKSTLAAAAYLRDLYAQFGSWQLAQAAYNAGEMTVIRAIRAVGSTDFWALARSGSLAQETKEFVPQIHAATVIGRDPSRYGFDFGGPPPMAAAVEFVSIPPGTNLAVISKSTGVSTETLRALNPVLVKGVTPPGGAYQLRVPAGTSPATSPTAPGGKLAADRRSTTPAKVHLVRSGDTMNGIAKRHGISVGDLRRWNNLAGDHVIRPGDRLVVAEATLSANREGSPLAR